MIDKVGNLCCGCSACTRICPKNCISMKENSEGFLYPVVDNEKCVKCGLCEKTCPVLHTSHGTDLREAYGAITKDNNILLLSSSGGIFTGLATLVLADGGCIFGAAFSDDFHSIQHVMVENAEGLSALRGSKYVQSAIGDTYREAKVQLEKGRRVLFSGTPCQIAGLKNYLGKEYEKLLLVDIICHGTPSPALWDRYLTNVETRMGGNASYVSFRHKEHGWRKFGMELPIHSGKRYFKELGEDPYLIMFLRNYCLRESCYNCHVKETGSAADITIGDFWGVEHVAPEIDNSMGVSLALVHTEKGKRYYESAAEHMRTIQTDYDSAISHNIAMNHSVARPTEREKFFADMNHMDWDKLVKKYTSVPLKTRVRQMLSRSMISKIKRRLLHRSSAGGGKSAFQYGLIIEVEAGE